MPKTFIKEGLPTLRSGPPLNIQAAYDKEVLLEVSPGDDYSSQNSKIIWSINNKKICTGVYCPIVLKESDYLERAPILDIITFNEYGGTTYTYEFEIRSKEGFDSKSLNKETEYVKPKNESIDSFSSQKVSAIFGKGTLIQRDYILYIGSVSRFFNWKEGIFQTDNLDTLKISDSESGLWFLLPSSNLSIQSPTDDDQLRRSKLNLGSLRVKASGSRNDTDENTESFTNKMEIETEEIKILVSRGTDVVMTRGKENNKLFTKIIVFSGEAQLIPNIRIMKESEKFKEDKIKLGTGLEFTIYEDGSIKPLSSPNSSTIDYFIAFTTTQEELKARYETKNIDNLSEILDRASILA
ncbi:MAG: hypothetical protein K2X69_07265, partial [Silvanigrellaceae bacterium]|nr:hypothetical protein [Silvanigrellaceae bacterium]